MTSADDAAQNQSSYILTYRPQLCASLAMLPAHQSINNSWLKVLGAVLPGDGADPRILFEGFSAWFRAAYQGKLMRARHKA